MAKYFCGTNNMNHDPKQNGQILIIALIFMVIILVAVVILLGFVGQNVQGTRRGLAREQALQIADAGVDKGVWRLNQTAGAYTGEADTAFANGVFDVSVAAISPTVREITATAYVPDKINITGTKTVKVRVQINTQIVQFNYGVQVGEGGLVMGNNSRVNGNVYSNGSIDGGSGARITGDAYSAGAGGRIFDRIQIDGSAYAHQIDGDVVIGGNAHGYVLTEFTAGGNAYAYSLEDCTIGGSANYTTISSCSVGGTNNPGYPGDPDPPSQPFPITDQQITDWKTTAEGGGTIVGDYILINGAQGTLGPRKITGNLNVSNNAKLTLTGPLWVVGTINLSNNGIVALNSSYGNSSETIVADGVVDVSNNAIFQGAGGDSYILMITTSSAADAFDVANNADTLIIFAPNGTVNISNNALLREVTAYRLNMSNNAVVTYESGLANVQFSGGPGGSWVILPGTWRVTD